MPIAYIPQDCKDNMYFLTPTIHQWYYIFDRHNRWDILADSLIYCQKNKGLKIYAYVFMLNHLHLIVQSDDVSGFMRDFKKYTSKALKRNIAEFEPNTLKLFLTDDGSYYFWKPDNQPKIIETGHFFEQKLNYIHNNPVVKGYVMQPEHWKWSSANPESSIIISPF